MFHCSLLHFVVYYTILRCRQTCMDLQTTFRLNLTRLLSQRGITAYRLSKMSGVSQAALSLILRGQRGTTLSVLEAISSSLDIPPFALLIEGYNPDNNSEDVVESTAMFQQLSNDSLNMVKDFVAFKIQQQGINSKVSC